MVLRRGSLVTLDLDVGRAAEVGVQLVVERRGLRSSEVLVELLVENLRVRLLLLVLLREATVAALSEASPSLFPALVSAAALPGDNPKERGGYYSFRVF